MAYVSSSTHRLSSNPSTQDSILLVLLLGGALLLEELPICDKERWLELGLDDKQKGICLLDEVGLVGAGGIDWRGSTGGGGLSSAAAGGGDGDTAEKRGEDAHGELFGCRYVSNWPS